MTENNIYWIKTVKLQENGWLVNNSMSVPNDKGNRHYKEIQEWLKDNTLEPEFTEEEIAKQEQAQKVAKAQVYLKETDFYMTVDKYASLSDERKAELETKREEAREVIRNYEIS